MLKSTAFFLLVRSPPIQNLLIQYEIRTILDCSRFCLFIIHTLIQKLIRIFSLHFFLDPYFVELVKVDDEMRQVLKKSKSKTKFSQALKSDYDSAENFESMELYYENSVRGNKILILGPHKYIRNNVYGSNVYWKCTKWHTGCRSRAITSLTDESLVTTRNIHNHALYPNKDEN